MISKKVYISGKVQGVGFRFHAHEKARELKLKGWVRNLKDGRVEMLVVGSDLAVGEMIKWAQKGPPTAKVEKVESSDTSYDSSEIEDFSIRRD